MIQLEYDEHSLQWQIRICSSRGRKTSSMNYPCCLAHVVPVRLEALEGELEWVQVGAYCYVVLVWIVLEPGEVPLLGLHYEVSG